MGSFRLRVQVLHAHPMTLQVLDEKKHFSTRRALYNSQNYVFYALGNLSHFDFPFRHLILQYSHCWIWKNHRVFMLPDNVISY